MSGLGDCTVITVTYNSRCVLEQVRDQWLRYPRLIAVDNGSVDGTADWIASELPHCQLLRSPGNTGYGCANNLALARVTTPYALLLNPDCCLTGPNLEAMLECARANPDAALIGPRYVDIHGKPQEACRLFFHRSARRRGAYVEPVGDLCTEFISGAAMLVNVAHMRDLGGFDPWYFLYCEDEDLAWRARQAGRSVMVAAAAVAAHSPMRSSPSTPNLTFLRHYCHTLSKLYLRRRVGYSTTRRSLYALSVLTGSLLLLPLRLLGLSMPRAMRELARILAVLTAPVQLALPACRPTPGALWRSLLRHPN